MYRRAHHSDVDAVVALMAAYYAEESYAFDRDQAFAAVDRLVNDSTLGEVWVACVGPEVVSYVAVTLGFSLEYGGRDAFIDDLYVAPEHRGQGLGRAAMETAFAACRAMGANAIDLEVERYKHAAQTLYRERGFVDGDRYLMTKVLR